MKRPKKVEANSDLPALTDMGAHGRTFSSVNISNIILCDLWPSLLTRTNLTVLNFKGLNYRHSSLRWSSFSKVLVRLLPHVRSTLAALNISACGLDYHDDATLETILFNPQNKLQHLDISQNPTFLLGVGPLYAAHPTLVEVCITPYQNGNYPLPWARYLEPDTRSIIHALNAERRPSGFFTTHQFAERIDLQACLHTAGYYATTPPFLDYTALYTCLLVLARFTPTLPNDVVVYEIFPHFEMFQYMP